VTLGAHTRTVQAALVDDVIHMTEPEGETAFLWMLGQRPA
jgi:hypothetical protein